MKSDIEIAQAANMIPIWEVAEQLNIPKDELEMYGKYKAKLGDELWDRVKDNPDGKLILVTAINPTPAGEGKTTTSVGLGQAMGKLGKKAVIALREPSLGPCFGIKGGAAGGKPELDDLRMRAAFIWEKVLHSVKNCGIYIIRNTILKERSTVQ